VEDKKMKAQVLNGSFGKVLVAAATIAFMISVTSRAQAQQGQWGADRCYYAAAQNGQVVRQGCMLTGNLYRDNATNVITDLQTRIQFFRGQDGRMLILTSSGWVEAQAYVAQVQAARANQAQAPTSTAGIVGGVYKGSGTQVVGGYTIGSGNAQVDTIIGNMNDTLSRIWTAPNCNASYNGCR
jgi:hypothetical protein